MRSYWMAGLLIAAVALSGCSRHTPDSKDVIQLAVEETGADINQIVTALKQVSGKEFIVVKAAKDGIYDTGISHLDVAGKENMGIYSIAVGEPRILTVVADHSYGYIKELAGKKIGCLSKLPEKHQLEVEQTEDVALNLYQDNASLEADLKEGILDGILLESEDAADFMVLHPNAGWKVCQLKDASVLSQYFYTRDEELIRQAASIQRER
ncbi:MAG: hypothetical protein RSD33_10955 [Clostridium sp.]